MGPELLILGTIATAGSSIMQGQEQARAAKFEQQQLDRQSQEFRIAGAQAETERRERLTSNLETILSIRAGRNVGSASPTALASIGEIISDESGDIQSERYNYLSKAEQAKLGAKMAGRRAKSSLLAGYLGAVGDLGQGYARYSYATSGTKRVT